MQWFKNLRLASKLALSFSAVVLLTVTMGLFALLQLGTLRSKSDEVTGNWLPSVRLTSALNTNTSDFRIAAMQHVLSTDDADKGRLEGVMAKLADKIKKEEAEYVALISSPQERQLWDRFKQEWAGYLRQHEQMLKLSRANQDEEANRLLQGASQTHFDQASTVLLKLVELNTAGADQAARDVAATHASAIRSIAAVLTLVVVVSALLVWRLSGMITRPLQQAVGTAERVAAGDLTSRIEAASQDETGQLLAALSKMNQGLVQIVSQVRLSSDSIATGASQIDSGNADLSQRTEEQAANLEETAASMEQLSATVRQNADTARTAAQLATTATGAAARGGEVVGQVVQTMEDISSSSRRIVDIIGTIDGIAFQTNILALNAAVEAARAGEQGRGFAVVAGEVRSLAQRAADAAKEIKSLITANMERVDSGTRQVAEAGQAMNELVGQVQRVNDLISEISAATHEQTSGISQVSDAVSQLDQVTQQNAALVEESAAAAGSLSQQARSLVQVVGAFRVHESEATRTSAAPSMAGRSNLAPPAHNALVGSNRSLPTGLKAQPAARPQTAVSSTPSPSPVAMPAPAAVSPKAAAPVAAGDDWETF